MTNSLDDIRAEELVQRFIDQELTAEERLQFVARLGRDEALRRRAMELESLVLDASRLPRPIVPAGFTASVLRRLPEPSVWQRLSAALWTGRTLQWNLAGAMAVAAILVLAVSALVVRERGATPTPGTPGTSGTPGGTLPVRLVMMQPGAKVVQVAGDFNGWNPAQTPLERVSADGAWSVTIPLKPGRYAYMFVVDGRQWVADPFASEQKDDGFGSRNAVVDVRPDVKTGASL
jgi:hypothetical protein